MTHTPAIDPSLPVNEIIRRWPATMRVLNAFGIDTCCGGAEPLAAAAAESSTPLDDLLVALHDVLAATPPRA